MDDIEFAMTRGEQADPCQLPFAILNDDRPVSTSDQLGALGLWFRAWLIILNTVESPMLVCNTTMREQSSADN